MEIVNTSQITNLMGLSRHWGESRSERKQAERERGGFV